MQELMMSQVFAKLLPSPKTLFNFSDRSGNNKGASLQTHKLMALTSVASLSFQCVRCFNLTLQMHKYLHTVADDDPSFLIDFGGFVFSTTVWPKSKIDDTEKINQSRTSNKITATICQFLQPQALLLKKVMGPQFVVRHLLSSCLEAVKRAHVSARAFSFVHLLGSSL